MAEPHYSPAMIAQLVALARAAGSAILNIYEAGGNQLDMQIKADNSPLTAADLAAHQILMAGLPEILKLPLISEEGELSPYTERAFWAQYWLIDPLDGTKEFLQRNGEFTVNIALIAQGAPVLGVVHVPVQDVTYVGINPPDVHSKIAYKVSGDSAPEIIRVRSLQAKEQAQTLTILASHRHGTQRLSELLSLIDTRWPGEVKTSTAGSSLKFCLIAEGRADFYPRLAPTSEWDTAAAQAVLEAAGGAVVDAEAFERGELMPLRYNTREAIINPDFYAFGDLSFDWKKLVRC